MVSKIYRKLLVIMLMD